MKISAIFFPVLLVVLVTGFQAPGASGEFLADVDFESGEIGRYTEEQVRSDWKKIDWVGLHGRASIVQDDDTARGKVLKMSYPRGAVGPSEGGGQFEVTLPPARELWLSYFVKFGKGFDFRLGGKMPGLTSGGDTFTGGNKPTHGEGWSARFMWRKNGEAVVYLYHVEMPGKWGEDLPLGGFHFETGKWHRITEHIRVNTPDQADGILEAWIDGRKLLSRSDIRFRIGEQGLIDSLYFSTFHGGNTAEWGPEVDCVCVF